MINQIQSNLFYHRVEARFLLRQPPTQHLRKKKSNRPHTRACLVWNKTKEACTLLLTTTFNNKNPISNGNIANSLNLTKEELVKRLVAIHQTPPLIGRPSIRFEVMPSPDEILDVNQNSYLPRSK